MFGSLFNQKKGQTNDQSQPQDGSQEASSYSAAPGQDQSAASVDQSQQSSAPQSYQSDPQQVQQDQQPVQNGQAQPQNAQDQQSAQTTPGQPNPNQSNQQGQPGQPLQGGQGNPNDPHSANPAMRSDMSALSHLDPRSTQVLTHAQEETRRIKQQYIEPDQILFGLLYDEQIYKLLEESSADGGHISKEIQAHEKMGTYKGQPSLSKISQGVFDQAYRDAKIRGSNFISPEDLFLVLFAPNYSTAAYLNGAGLKKEGIIEKVSKNPNSGYAKKTILEKFGIDLTEEAKEGRLDPVAGRDKEVDRIVHILLRRTKNNPIIIGETGVGKTAIVEGLAQKIVAGGVPKDLQDKRIFQLDVASLVAGASHRGEFEERLRGVINEVLGSNNRIVLFIDEIHSLMGTGEGEGMNAANIIKPHLARGHFQLIGATTTIEYRKNFEKDKAFERRFQPVIAEEPSEENAFEMLKVLRAKYEKFHRVTMPDETLKECVKLSKKYIGERYLPDKAVDLLDEAASDVKLQTDAGKRGDTVVKKGDVERVVSAWTGIPITKLTEDESEKLLKLEDRIHKRLIDQEEAVVAVSEAVRRGRIGLAAANRPIASFVFLGPTGVGKTELAKTLAELLFGRDDSMARLDMSEYMEKHEVAKLIGAPPGYVGYEEGGQLTEAVRKKPYSIVLLDEIEKAHPDVFNILLQLLEDGRLTDNKGNTISFKNTIVICTSNIGSSLIQQQLSLQDPKAKKSNDDFNKAFKQLQTVVKEELIKFFRPELLNRFDEVVIFKPLMPEHMAGIARLAIAKTAALLKEQGFNLQITEKAIAKLAKDGYDPVYGARPLRRLVQTVVENPIALAIISHKFVPGDTIVIDFNDNTNEFFFTKGGQSAAQASSLNDEQFKSLLLSIAKPDGVLDEREKIEYKDLHEKAVKAGAGGNKTANDILSVIPATSISQVQVIRNELEAQKAKGDELATAILELASKMASEIQAAARLKKVLLEIINPESITSPEKKEKFTAIHDALIKESQVGNPLAGTILAVTPASAPETIGKIMEELRKGKDQENELATEILAAVNSEIAEEAEEEQAVDPVFKFKKVLKQVINPLYLASPENKDKFSQLYDKISKASEENNPLAASIMAITDITSDSDIAQLKEQLEMAKTQGDQLAAEIIDAIEAGVKHEEVSKLKKTLLFIVNPIASSSPQERENYTSVREKLSEASQKGNELATNLLSVSDETSDDDLLKIKTGLEEAKEKGDEIATLVLDTVEIARHEDGTPVSGAPAQGAPVPGAAPVPNAPQGQGLSPQDEVQVQAQNLTGQPIPQSQIPMPTPGAQYTPVQGSPLPGAPMQGAPMSGNQAPNVPVQSQGQAAQYPPYQGAPQSAAPFAPVQNQGAASGPAFQPPYPQQPYQYGAPPVVPPVNLNPDGTTLNSDGSSMQRDGQS